MAVNINYYRRSKSFRKFLDERESLLIQFKQGDINKREFIESNLDMIARMGLKPFQKIDSLEKGIYTYQYYNMMAKHTYLKARDELKKGKHMTLYQNLVREAEEFYRKKDNTTFQLLRFLEYQNMEAYPIKVKSEALKGKLFEIVIREPEFFVFHSTSRFLKSRLIEEGIYDEKKKSSVVPDYVNQRY